MPPILYNIKSDHFKIQQLFTIKQYGIVQQLLPALQVEPRQGGAREKRQELPPGPLRKGQHRHEPAVVLPWVHHDTQRYLIHIQRPDRADALFDAKFEESGGHLDCLLSCYHSLLRLDRHSYCTEKTMPQLLYRDVGHADLLRLGHSSLSRRNHLHGNRQHKQRIVASDVRQEPHHCQERGLQPNGSLPA